MQFLVQGKCLPKLWNALVKILQIKRKHLVRCAMATKSMWWRIQCTFVSAEPYQQHSGDSFQRWRKIKRLNTRQWLHSPRTYSIWEMKMVSSSLTAACIWHAYTFFPFNNNNIVQLIIIYDFMELWLWLNVASLPTTSNAQLKRLD